MVNKINDATQDAAQLIDSSTVVLDDSFGVTDIYDLKQADPAQFKVRLEWLWTAVAAAYQVVTVVGSTDAAGTDSYILASHFLGDPAEIATRTGVTPSGNYTGSGSYVFHCSNVGSSNITALAGNQQKTVCRYIKVAVQTIGVGSVVFFTARVDQN